MTPPTEYVLGLVQQAFADLDAVGLNLTAVYRKALRIAQLREDHRAIYWIQNELNSSGDRDAHRRSLREIAHHFTEAELRDLHEKTLEAFFSARGLEYVTENGDASRDKITSLSLEELEQSIAMQRRELEHPPTVPADPRGGYALGFSAERLRMRRIHDQSVLRAMERVHGRLRQRVHAYLSQTERALVFAEQTVDALSSNRHFVEAELRGVCPTALAQLRSAAEHVRKGTPEDRALALTSCRRALKSIADVLYPPRSEPVMGRDGKRHEMTDAKFISRLWQFVIENLSNEASQSLLIQDVKALGGRFDALNSLSSKGVHHEVSEVEASVCLSRTYTVIGDLLRLRAGVSAASAPVERFGDVAEDSAHS